MENFNQSSNIKISKFIADVLHVKSELPYDIDAFQGAGSLRDNMNVSKNLYKEIHGKCGPHIFKKYGNLHTDVDVECVGLAVTELQKKENEKKRSRSGYRSFLRHAILKDYDMLLHLHNFKQGNVISITNSDIILSVTLYTPNQILPDSNYVFPFQIAMRVDQTFDVMGRNLLTMLKEKIYCDLDYGVCEDISSTPEKNISYFTKDIFKSGFFLIEDTFYNDMRFDANIDYSKVIMDWAADPLKKLGPFKSVKMEETKFENLEIQLGKPYMYLHQGDCQHLFIFSDLRFMNGNDIQNTCLYPIRTYLAPEKIQYCYICGLNPVKYITYDDPHVPEDPSLFCRDCFKYLHYDAEGKKKGNFKAYFYFDRNTYNHIRPTSTYFPKPVKQLNPNDSD